ncbi:exosome complex component Rrp4p [[Candida] railenensis]|uniref:Exosome complex component Rrp4p n=1 Tax=[Candida] railenensis TaxID=45579 RepID=A0A9P0QSQ1_9ASCO|nr:exosome complex component Rrp4p [[Candida] railenensis]
MSVISITRPTNVYDDEPSDIEMSDVEESGELKKESAGESIVTPGELVTDDPVWMKGHGTYFLHDQTYSSVAGSVSRVNRLLSVIPLRGRYQAETGDHVVGRITEVGPKRWKVDIGCKQDAVLMLGSVNLPGGVLRRKSESDELQMRNFLKEGDLLNAEVQSIFSNGSASLHTRSLKYGKLRNGIFLKVPSSLVVKSKNHSYNLPGNVSVIVGVNGYVWLSKSKQGASSTTSATTNKAQAAFDSSSSGYNPGQGSVSITRLEEESSWEIYSDKNESISNSVRHTITRYYNVIKALAFGELGITEQRIIMGYEASLAYEDVGSLIDKEAMESICQDVINSEKMRG